MNKIEELLKNEKVEWKKLGEVCTLERGKTITKKNTVKGKIPVVGGGKTAAYYHNESNRPAGTISVAGSGAYAGFINYWNEPIFLSDAFSVAPNSKTNLRYLFHFLLSKQNDIYKLKKGSGIPHVYISDLSKILIPLPSLEIQEKIAKILDNYTNYVTELQAELQAELQQRQKQYEYYREKLLDFPKD